MKKNSEIDMWNKGYQAERVRYGRLINHGVEPNCFDYCLMAFFKYLIHIFVALIVISFATMMVIVSRERSGYYESEKYDASVKQMTEILKLHPYYYGLHKAGEQVGINFTEGFSDYIESNMRGQYHPQPKNLKIPEIYKKFQETSPLSIFKDYKIEEVDMSPT